ncbi:hypothetical protein B0H14DRAFT_2565196 [Mycena olivaceomarginata]|nr:hypothetical protein B0H14DRAFT_2565196 [Mycena olivaceomarginata]
MSQSSITDYTDMQSFQRRSAPGGVYESFLSELEEKPDLLANAELIGSAKHPANVSFSSLGEIADATHGTVVRANGNHYEGGPRGCLSDKNAPRHVLVLKTPTDAPDELINKFFDQIAFARELENVERAIDRKSGKTNVLYKGALRSTNGTKGRILLKEGNSPDETSLNVTIHESPDASPRRRLHFGYSPRSHTATPGCRTPTIPDVFSAHDVSESFSSAGAAQTRI